MSTPSVHVLGYEIVAPSKEAHNKPHKLSRRFVIKSAAETALELIRKWHPDAYLREVHGTEGVKGGKRFLRKVGSI